MFIIVLICAVVAIELAKRQSFLAAANYSNQQQPQTPQQQQQHFREAAPPPYRSSPQFGRLPGLPQQHRNHNPTPTVNGGGGMHPQSGVQTYRPGAHVKEVVSCRRMVNGDGMDDVDADDEDEEDMEEEEEEETTVSCGKPAGDYRP